MAPTECRYEHHPLRRAALDLQPARPVRAQRQGVPRFAAMSADEFQKFAQSKPLHKEVHAGEGAHLFPQHEMDAAMGRLYA